MSDAETDYARTEYQATEYQWSESETEHRDEPESEPPAREVAGPSVTASGSSISGLPTEVLDILRERWPAWKESQGSQRKRQWRLLVQELRELDVHRGMDKPEWVHRLKVCICHYKEEQGTYISWA